MLPPYKHVPEGLQETIDRFTPFLATILFLSAYCSQPSSFSLHISHNDPFSCNALQLAITLKPKPKNQYTDGMEGHKSKMMTVLVAEINRTNEENQNLNTMLNRMINNYDDLKKHIKFLVQEKQQLPSVDPIQIFNPHRKSEDNFNLRILSPRPAEIDSSGAVSHQTYHSLETRDQFRELEVNNPKFMDDMQLPSKQRKINYAQMNQSHNGMIINSSINDNLGVDSNQTHHSSDCHERFWDQMDGKKLKYMDDIQLPSKKRKINYGQLGQIQNGMVDSSMDDSLISDELPNKNQSGLSKGSREQMAASPKRIVSVRTRTEASVIRDGCQWRKYGQKLTRNNPHPRSYYRCAMSPSCPVKRQVQRCADDSTIVVTIYEGEHTHFLSRLAIAVTHAGSSNQLIDEDLHRTNRVAENQLIPFSTSIARISTSSPFPTITLDLSDNQPNAGLHMQPHLKAGSFQHLIPLPNNMGHALDLNQLNQSPIMDSVASIKADPNFTAALAVAIAGSMLKLGGPIEGMPKHVALAGQYNDGSTLEACV